MNQNNLSSNQPELNLQNLQFPVARQRTTRDLRRLIEVLTGEKLTAREILQHGKQGNWQIPCTNGVVIVNPSIPPKKARFWRWDLFFWPVSTTQISA